MRFPCDILRFARLPGIGIFLGCADRFELVGRGGGAPGILAVLKSVDHGCIPGRVEISSAWARFHGDAIAAPVCVCGGVQRLVNIADELNEERQITDAASFVAMTLFEAFGVFADLRGDAVSARGIAPAYQCCGPVNRC